MVFKKIPIPHLGGLTELKDLFLPRENSGRRNTMSGTIGNGHTVGDKM